MPGGLDALIPRNEEGDHIRAEKAERYLGKQLPLFFTFGTTNNHKCL